MTLEEAIGILADSAWGGSTTFDENFRKAEKLGIEAMKLLKDARISSIRLVDLLLPGETK